MNFAVMMPKSGEQLLKIMDLDISGTEMKDLSEKILKNAEFNYIQRAFLHYCLGLKAYLDLEKTDLKRARQPKEEERFKIKVDD